MKPAYLSFALAAAVALSASAASAPWFKWRSKLNGTIICTQVMHGAWEKADGPFKDARCELPGTPG